MADLTTHNLFDEYILFLLKKREELRRIKNQIVV